MFRSRSKARLSNNSNQTATNLVPPVPSPPPGAGQPSATPVPAPPNLQPFPDPVVLAWTPAAEAVDPEPSIANEAPPDYAVARNPVQPVRYQFSSLGANSMLLLPPADSPDTRPVYHISVRMNCFVPYSYITTIRRGGTEEGEFVGDFELGTTVNHTTKQPTICLREREYPMSDSIQIKRGKDARVQRVWTWTPHREDRNSIPSFKWHFDIPERGSFKCRLKGNQDAVLAKFTPSKRLRQRNRPVELPTLEVTPQGHKYFDDILMSLLIVERQRNFDP